MDDSSRTTTTDFAGWTIVLWDDVAVARVGLDLSAEWMPLYWALTDEERSVVAAKCHAIQISARRLEMGR
jgi:hypothetical protein